MNRSEHINEIVAALSKAQAAFKLIHKDTENPYYRSKYADLSQIIAATQPALNSNGLVVIQAVRTKMELSITEIETMLAHSSGQWMSDTLELPATMLGKDGKERFDAQSVGSSQTYGRRYAMQAILGVAAEVDDDGNAAAGNGGSVKAAQAVAERKIAEHNAKKNGGSTDLTPALKASIAHVTDNKAQAGPFEVIEIYALQAPFVGMVGLRGNGGINVIKSSFPFGQPPLEGVIWLDTVRCYGMPAESIKAFSAAAEKCQVGIAVEEGIATKNPIGDEDIPWADLPIIRSCDKHTKGDKAWWSIMLGEAGEHVCWDKKIGETLVCCVGQPADLEIEDRVSKNNHKTYKNIVGIKQVGVRKYENNQPIRTLNDGSAVPLY